MFLRTVRSYSIIIFSLLLISVTALADKNNPPLLPDPIAEFLILNDSSGLEFSEIQKISPEKFSDYEGEKLHLNKTYWFKVEILNSELESDQSYIHFYNYFSRAEVFQLDPDSTVVSAKSGTLVPAKERAVKGLFKDILPFRMSGNSTTTLFIKADKEMELIDDLNVSILSDDTFNRFISFNTDVQSIFAGAIFIVFLLNLILFILSHERLYFWYITYLAIMTIFFLSYAQILERSVLSNYPKFDLYLIFNLAFHIPIYALFLNELLREENVPNARGFLKKFALVTFVCACIIYVISRNNYLLSAKLNDLFLFVNIFLLIGFFFVFFRKVSTTAKVVFIGTQFIVIGGFASIVTDFIKYSPFHVFYYQAGFSLELIFFTISVNYMHHKNKLTKTKALLKNAQIETEYLRKTIEINELNSTIDQKNRNLVSKAILVSEKEQLIEKLIDELQQLKSGEAAKPDIDRMLSSLRTNHHNNNWPEFELHFKNVHPRFYESLNEKYPDLTANERKVCAFIKLNLSTKEISQITGKSINTINVARARLRKKMKLNSSENISTIIANIG
ncbi:7TM diverse intracellular signaling domain-containing protein [Draconibacterium sp. IB214405]|uniref:7TM diverse intracellular signaling domain-containing protein n=1 Tax=Draconibacterium sp. IB214405 TaxID=3097352 RepID=UPI002A14B8E8|nr:7TM diverse intracellular signaling domain-containing protein [Draconibacterium sp. IB214405]MDX8340363.1 7TM diverse intracellular signaling domain-containing protein [Draconibacterium sp. IB214405]